MIQKPLIEIINPRLIKDYYQRDQYYEFPKGKLMGRVKKFLAGGGILLHEGEEWHRRRKIINRVFTFEIIKNNTQKIKEICRKEILKSEQKARKTEEENKVCFSYSILSISHKIFSNVVAECFLGDLENIAING